MSTYSTKKNIEAMGDCKNSADHEDRAVRVISIPNLAAMCERQSTTPHYYWIEFISRSRVTVGYSNPDEYGGSGFIFAVYPVIPAINPAYKSAVLSLIKVMADADLPKTDQFWQTRMGVEDGHQAFEWLEDAPELWRTDQGWKTEYEIMVPDFPHFAVVNKWIDQSQQRWFVISKPDAWYTNYLAAQRAAVGFMKEERERSNRRING